MTVREVVVVMAWSSTWAVVMFRAWRSRNFSRTRSKMMTDSLTE